MVRAIVGRLSKAIKGDGLRAQLLRGGVGSVVVKGASTLLAMAVAIILARALGPHEFGTYSYVFALISLMSIPAQFGLPNLVVRETAKAQANEQWSLMRGLWRWSNAVAGGISIGLVAIMGILAWNLTERFTNLQLATFVWGLALVPLMVLGNLRGAALQGLRHVVAGQLPEFVLRPGFLILSVAVAVTVWPTVKLTSANVMMLHAGAAAIAFGIGAWMLYRVRPLPLRAHPKPEYQPKQWLHAAVPMALMAGMLIVSQQTSILILGLFRMADEVGIYRAASQSSMFVLFGLQAIDLVVGPHFARLHKAGDFVRLQQVATLSARVSVIVAMPVSLIFILWGGDVLNIVFGEEFVRGHTALSILTIGQLLNTATGSVGWLLNMTGYERATARGILIAACVNVALSFLFIPYLGINGAALATALTLGTWNILLWRDARSKLGIECDVLSLGVRNMHLKGEK